MTLKKLNKGLIGAIILSVSLIVGCTSDNTSTDKDNNKENTKINEEIEKEEDLGEYRIELIDDANIGSVIRETIHIVVPEDTNLDTLYKIAEKEALKYTKENKVNALAIGFYFDKSNIGKGYDFGRVEYVPNGKWEDATNIKAGDYSNFKFVNELQEPLKLTKGESIQSTSGDTNTETIKSDILEINDSKVSVSKNKDILVINIIESEDSEFFPADENAIAAYTDWCLENIKSDITKIDITVKRPSSSASALLEMSKMETSNGRYFDANYIAQNLK